MPDIDYEASGKEGLLISTIDPQLVLTGGRPRRTLYGVYEFLDAEFVYRWHTNEGMTPAVTHIPCLSKIKISPLNKTKVPPLDYRSKWYRKDFEGDWAIRNRLNRQNRAGTEMNNPVYTTLPRFRS